jgi:hypothetical protein
VLSRRHAKSSYRGGPLQPPAHCGVLTAAF